MKTIASVTFIMTNKYEFGAYEIYEKIITRP